MIFMVKCVQEVLPDTHFFFCSVKTLINIILCLLKSVKVQPQQKQLNFPNTSGNFLKRTGHFLGTNLLSFRDKPERLTWYLVVVLGPWRTTNYTTYHWIYDGWFGRGARSFFVLAPSRNRKLRHWNGNFWKRFVFVVLLGATTRRKKKPKKERRSGLDFWNVQFVVGTFGCSIPPSPTWMKMNVKTAMVEGMLRKFLDVRDGRRSIDG